MNNTGCSHPGRTGALLFGLAFLGGCGSLLPDATPQATFYSLDQVRQASDETSKRQPSSASAPALLVSPTRSASGLDSQHITYLRQNHTVEHFANSEWVDLPARMLTQLIVSRLERGGDFRAVVATPNSATGELRLDTELLRLQHDFTIQPSRVRITMRAYLVDNRTRQVLAWKEIDETVIAGSGDAYGGVVAANKAVNAMLAGLSAFCADGAARWEQTESLVPGAPRAR